MGAHHTLTAVLLLAACATAAPKSATDYPNGQCSWEMEEQESECLVYVQGSSTYRNLAFPTLLRPKSYAEERHLACGQVMDLCGQLTPCFCLTPAALEAGVHGHRLSHSAPNVDAPDGGAESR